MTGTLQSEPENMELPSRPRLAIALGDPAGIGPEVALKALADPAIAEMGDVTLVGSRALLQTTYQQLLSRLSPSAPVQALACPDDLQTLEVTLPAEIEQQVQPGMGNAASGEASFRFLQTAIAQTLAGKFDGIVTAPIAKSAWKAAGHLYPGQTELLAEQAGVERFGMLFVARSPHTRWTLRTLLATTHIPLRQVPDMLSPALMSLKLDLLVETLQQDFGIAAPTVAIAGLNPHSGEQGQLGVEEQDWLIPWMQVEQQGRSDVRLIGPVPPDTLWVKAGQAWYGPAASGASVPDAYLALYHDQGLIPVKLMAFDRAINTTIGLPFIRTSPDHGTAFDIAGQGVADASSMKAAIELVIELVQTRKLIKRPPVIKPS